MPACPPRVLAKRELKDTGLEGQDQESLVRVSLGGPEWTVDGTVFEMWLGGLRRPE